MGGGGGGGEEGMRGGLRLGIPGPGLVIIFELWLPLVSEFHVI